MQRSYRVTGALMTVALLAAPLPAWDSFGHMVVAGVAYRNLDSQTRARADKLLALNPYYKTHWSTSLPAGVSKSDRKMMIFMLAATWPDAIKSDPKYKNDGDDNGDRPTGPESSRNTGYDDFNRHKYWHFVDEPFTQDGTDLSGFILPSPNALTQIDIFRGVLGSSSPDRLKSYDLVWLLHLIGDVHQPLHCATRVSKAHPTGDAGGNGVGFCGVSAKKCTGELHAFWDDILGTGTNVASANKFAGGLTAPPVTALDIAHAKDWVMESEALAASKVYVPPVGSGDGPFQATADYTGNTRSTARERVSLAGARLAAVLKADLK